MTARLVVLAGPTAVGKGTVAARVRRDHPDIFLSVSATTRKPRPGERDGVHYWFVSEEEFDRMIAADELLEWAVVHGTARYGTPRRPVEEALASGRSALLEIDLQGARQVKEALTRIKGGGGLKEAAAALADEALFVFLAPPSWDELVRRLVGRGTESEAERVRRLDTAKVELAAEREFDVTIINSEVSAAVAELVALLEFGVPQESALSDAPGSASPEDQ